MKKFYWDIFDLAQFLKDMETEGESLSGGIVTVSATMSTILMKKLYGLAYDWIVGQESHGLFPEEAHRQVQIVTDYPDFVWKHKARKGP